MRQVREVLTLCVVALLATSAAWGASGDSLDCITAPGPRPQGLAWVSGYLWVADDSTDLLYKVDPSDGSVDTSFAAPGSEPRGMSYDGTYLWVADNCTKRLYKVSASNGSKQDSLTAPGPGGTNWSTQGLAWDGTCLWSTYEAGWSSGLVRIDVSGDSTVWSDFSPPGMPRGLAASSTSHLWYIGSCWGIRTARITDTPLSAAHKRFDTPVRNPTGMTHDGSYLWVADEEAAKIYKLED